MSVVCLALYQASLYYKNMLKVANSPVFHFDPYEELEV